MAEVVGSLSAADCHVVGYVLYEHVVIRLVRRASTSAVRRGRKDMTVKRMDKFRTPGAIRFGPVDAPVGKTTGTFLTFRLGAAARGKCRVERGRVDE